ncbi:hypothetical protein [Acidovorax sp. ACV02]|nr:hypothetical protein [Acidovorax sp. ACV02]
MGESTQLLPVPSLGLGEAWSWQFSDFARGALLGQSLKAGRSG